MTEIGISLKKMALVLHNINNELSSHHPNIRLCQIYSNHISYELNKHLPEDRKTEPIEEVINYTVVTQEEDVAI